MLGALIQLAHAEPDKTGPELHRAVAAALWEDGVGVVVSAGNRSGGGFNVFAEIADPMAATPSQRFALGVAGRHQGGVLGAVALTNGMGIVALQDRDAVQVQAFDGSGSVRRQWRLGEVDSAAFLPALVRIGSDRVVLGWQTGITGRSRAGLWLQRLNGLAEPQGTTIAVPIGRGVPVSGPKLAAGPSGSLLAVWSQNESARDGHRSLWGCGFDTALKPVGPCPFRVTVETENVGVQFAVACPTEDRCWAVWRDSDLYAKSFDLGGRTIGETTRLVKRDGALALQSPQLAASGGKLLLTWLEEKDLEHRRVLAAFLDPQNGAHSSERIAVALQDEESRGGLQAATVAGGGTRFLVAWISGRTLSTKFLSEPSALEARSVR